MDVKTLPMPYTPFFFASTRVMVGALVSTSIDAEVLETCPASVIVGKVQFTTFFPSARPDWYTSHPGDDGAPINVLVASGFFPSDGCTT